MHTPATLRGRTACLLLACAALAACGRGGDAVVIGTAGPFRETYAQMVRNAVQMAVDEANREGGGVDGRPIQVRAVDDEGDGVKAAAIARQFREDAAVAAVVGHANSGGMVGAAAEYDAGLVAVVPSATSPEITGISPWVFRVTTNDSVNGANLARFAAGLNKPRVAVLYENNVYGRDLARAFLAGYRGEVVGVDPIAGDGSKAEPFVSYYKGVNPDLVFVAGTEQSGRALLMEALRQGWRPQWLAGDGWTGIASDTAAAEGAYVATPFSVMSTREEARRFVERFQARWGAVPDANAAMAYDATRLLVQAMREVGTDRAKIRAYLARVKGERAFAGVTGQVRFRPDGDPEAAGFVMNRVVNGTLQPLEET